MPDPTILPIDTAAAEKMIAEIFQHCLDEDHQRIAERFLAAHRVAENEACRQALVKQAELDEMLAKSLEGRDDTKEFFDLHTQDAHTLRFAAEVIATDHKDWGRVALEQMDAFVQESRHEP